jgi:3-oxoacyl-[acyl-carrier protein] reductase
MKIALVTGSAKRLGRQLALHLAEEGYGVWIHYLSSLVDAETTAKEIQDRGGQARAIKADMAQRVEVEEMFRRVRESSGHLDLLVNNVGEYRCGPLLDYPVEDFQSAIQTNLMGTYYAIRAAIPIFPETGGSILNIGYSGLQAMAAHPNNTAYTISKLGILSLTRAYAHELGSRGIRVNMISPGQLENSVDLPESFEDRVPLGRPGSLEDVSNLALFLASDKASYITGQNIDVAGGYMLKLEDQL